MSLVNLAGNTNLYVNPEVIPLDIKRSLWREESTASKSVIVLWAQRKEQTVPWKVCSRVSRDSMS